MAAFSAQGIRTFGDDVLILKKGQGMSFGFLTRLRSPLPKSLSASLLRYITKHTGPSNHKWIYLKPENPVQFGECKPIKAFVLLERNPQAKATLEPIREVDVLKRLVEDNIIRTLPLRIIFDRLHRLCKSRQRFRLTYSDPEEAVRLVINKFS